MTKRIGKPITIGFLLLFAAALGVVSYSSPFAGLGIAIVLFLVGIGFVYPLFSTKMFIASLSIAIVGYAFVGRPFGHIGVSPVYIGEVVLGLGILSATLHYFKLSYLRMPLISLILVFMIWGAFRTIPYLGTYKVMALRDAVVWGYATFAILIPPLLLRYNFIEEVPKWTARLIIPFLVIVPIIIVLHKLFRYSIPNVPGSDVSWLGLRPGEAGVHLAGAGAFLLLGLHRKVLHQPMINYFRSDSFAWTIWLVGFFVVGSVSRSGLLTVVASLFLVGLFRPYVALRHGAQLGAILVVVLLLIFTYDVSFDVGDKRNISVEQIIANFQSISGSDSRTELAGPRQWRLEWWTKIVDYTFSGPHFIGKGFGINLADDDGFAVDSQGSLRSPHNGHLTILARAGVPGIAIWVLFQIIFAASFIRAYRSASYRGDEKWACLNIWILAYWMAFMVNGSFDVFLEGPQGGIWFWSLVGFGIASLEFQRLNRNVEF
jgi:hypothetical protein